MPDLDAPPWSESDYAAFLCASCGCETANTEPCPMCGSETLLVPTDAALMVQLQVVAGRDES